MSPFNTSTISCIYLLFYILLFVKKINDRDSGLHFLQYKSSYMTINFSIPTTMHTYTLKSLASVAVLKSKIFIQPNQIPQTLMEDLRNIHTMCKLRKEESEIEEKLEDVGQRLSVAMFNARLYVNMWQDYINEDEFRDYIYLLAKAYEKVIDECVSEMEEIELDRQNCAGEEAMVLTKLPKEEFPEIYSLLKLLE